MIYEKKNKLHSISMCVALCNVGTFQTLITLTWLTEGNAIYLIILPVIERSSLVPYKRISTEIKTKLLRRAHFSRYDRAHKRFLLLS